MSIPIGTEVIVTKSDHPFYQRNGRVVLFERGRLYLVTISLTPMEIEAHEFGLTTRTFIFDEDEISLPHANDSGPNSMGNSD